MSAYKKVAPSRPPTSLSFVEAVTKYGDFWRVWVPSALSGRDELTQDGLEAAQMYYMERGLFSRVEDPKHLNDYAPIVLDWNGLVYTAIRDDGECGCAECHKRVGHDMRSKFAAIVSLLDAEEFRAEEFV